MSKTIPATIVPKRDGDYILITTPGNWGKGATVQAAKAAIKATGARLTGPWRIRSVSPDTYINEDGGIVHKKGHAPIVLMEYDPINKGLTLHEQGVQAYKRGCSVAAGPDIEADFKEWMQGYSAEEKRQQGA